MERQDLITKITNNRIHLNELKQKQKDRETAVRNARKKISDLKMEIEILDSSPQKDSMNIRQRRLNKEYSLEHATTILNGAQTSLDELAPDLQIAEQHLTNAKADYTTLMAMDGTDRNEMIEFVKSKPLNQMTTDEKNKAFTSLGGVKGVIEAGGSYA